MKLKFAIKGNQRQDIIPKLIPGHGITDNLDGIQSIKWSQNAKGQSLVTLEIISTEISVSNIPDKNGVLWNVESDGRVCQIFDNNGFYVNHLYDEVEIEADVNNKLFLTLTPTSKTKTVPIQGTLISFPADGFDTSNTTEVVDKTCDHSGGKYLSFNFYRCNICNEVVS